MSNLDAPENGNSDGVKIIKKATEQDKEDVAKTIIADSKTPWAGYLNSLNAKYQERIKKAAQQSNYSLTIRRDNGQEEKHIFARMKMLQYQFEEIEDLRAEATELSSADKPREGTKMLANMYRKAATYILWNAKEERPMNEDEYRHCIFSEVRPALDASMLLGLISDPN